jgi:hypothetical protein
MNEKVENFIYRKTYFTLPKTFTLLLLILTQAKQFILLIQMQYSRLENIITDANIHLYLTIH